MIGTRFQGQVRGISMDGYGVVDHPDKSVFFILGAFPGDEGTFEVIHLKKRYGFAKIIHLDQPSPHRQTPTCVHSGLRSGDCGGCPWMSLPYEKQLELKHHRLEHALRRDHLLPDDFEIPPVQGSPEIFGYRNRAQFKYDGHQIGYVSRFSHQLAPINDCLVLNPNLRELFQRVLKILPQEDWRPGPGYPWSYIDMDDEVSLESLIPNKRRPFKQGNTLQNVFMKNWVREKTQPWKNKNVMELFCGSGNFTTILAQQNLGRLTAVDIASEGVQKLKEKIDSPSCSVIEANLFKPSDWKLIKKDNPFVDALFLDPPRDGFNKLDMFVAQWGFQEDIIYISCDLETFVNDIGRLKRKGYQMSEVLGVDQFPHTPHIEILSYLRRLP